MINYYENGHKYLKHNLTIIPSVSELVQFATKENFWGIPESVLKKAGEFGTDIHTAIESNLLDEKEPDFLLPNYQNAWQCFLDLKDIIEGAIDMEQIITYQERYAGRYDLLLKDKKILIDFKTNSKYDDKLHQHLRWQMGYYNLGLKEQGIEVEKNYCMWLAKKGKGKLVEIDVVQEKDLVRNLEEYEINNKQR